MTKLFSEFQKSSFDDWRTQVTTDLKGKDFNDALVWEPLEGFEVLPFLVENTDLKESESSVQNVQKKELSWACIAEVDYSDERTTNQKILNCLNIGVDGIILKISEDSKIDFVKLLHGIKLSETPLFLKCHNFELLDELKKNIFYSIKGGVINDEVSGSFKNQAISATYFEGLAASINVVSDSPLFFTNCINLSEFHNAGATSVQELAFGISSLVTHIDKLTEAGLSAETITKKTFFAVSVGTNYFMEIAKLRALRVLWSRILNAYQLPESQVYILAFNSNYFDAVQSPHTNMLRATTEAMSAVIGGCNALALHPFNATFEQPDEFSERIAVNISTILKVESHLDKVADAAAGSYYIENLTQQLVDAAWDLFLKIEEMGGFLAACKTGYIQSKIEQTEQQRKLNMENGKEIRVGVNKYQEK